MRIKKSPFNVKRAVAALEKEMKQISTGHVTPRKLERLKAVALAAAVSADFALAGV